MTCAFNAVHLSINVPTQSLFLLVLLMSDYMALVGGQSLVFLSCFVNVFSVLFYYAFYINLYKLHGL